MNIQTRREGKTTLVSASGKVDATTAPTLETSRNDLIKQGPSYLVLDPGGVPYISSAGLRVILVRAKSRQDEDGVLLSADAQGPVQEVPGIPDFGSLFMSYDAVEAAVEAAN